MQLWYSWSEHLCFMLSQPVLSGSKGSNLLEGTFFQKKKNSYLWVNAIISTHLKKVTLGDISVQTQIIGYSYCYRYQNGRIFVIGSFK